MRTIMKTSRFAIAVCAVGGLALAGCMQQKSGETAAVAEAADDAVEAAAFAAPAKQPKLAPEVQTVKPGASVTVTHELSGKTEAGQNGSAKISLYEGYPGGAMIVKATGSEGLDVFGAGATSRFDMASGTGHDFAVSYRAETDGVYYINLMATAEPEGGKTEIRAHSIRVEIGDWQSAEASKPKPDMEMLPDGQRAVIMEAEETIGE